MSWETLPLVRFCDPVSIGAYCTVILKNELACTWDPICELFDVEVGRKPYVKFTWSRPIPVDALREIMAKLDELKERRLPIGYKLAPGYQLEEQHPSREGKR